MEINNFYQYVNREWLQTVKAPPAGYSRWSSFNEAEELIRKRLKQVLLSDVNSQLNYYQLPRTLYKSYIDTGRLAREGWLAANTYLDALRACKSKPEVMKFVCYYQRFNIHPFVTITVEDDIKESSVKRVYMSYGSLIVPDKKYYTSKYTSVLKRSLDTISSQYRLGWDVPALLQLDAQLATLQPNADSKRDVEKYYNKLTTADFIAAVSDRGSGSDGARVSNAAAPNVRREPGSNAASGKAADGLNLMAQQMWQAYFTMLPKNSTGDSIIILDMEYFIKLTKLLLSTDLQTLKQYIELHFLASLSDCIDIQLDDIFFDYFGRAVAGQQQQKSRETEAMLLLDKLVEKLMGRIYVENFYDSSCEQPVLEMVHCLTDELADIIESASWLSDNGKQSCLNKLNTMTVKIGYPDIWPKTESTAVQLIDDSMSLLAQVLVVRNFNYMASYSRLHSTRQRSSSSLRQGDLSQQTSALALSSREIHDFSSREIGDLLSREIHDFSRKEGKSFKPRSRSNSGELGFSPSHRQRSTSIDRSVNGYNVRTSASCCNQHSHSHHGDYNVRSGNMSSIRGSNKQNDSWEMGAHRVNAYYSNTQNTIYILAGFLVPPFFDMSWSLAKNYGAIGAIVAHELTHGFDDQGFKYDASGNLTNNWLSSDITAYTDHMINPMIQQFNSKKYHGRSVNGRLTVGENMADLGGLTLAIRAMEKLSKQQSSPQKQKQKQQQVYDQAMRELLESWAVLWRDVMTEQLLQELLTLDVHLPGELRANIVDSFDIFYQLYNVNPKSDMYLPPESRLHFWA